jgi:hypothetical protein
MSLREMMRLLVARYGRDEDRVCREYAAAEKRGDEERKSDRYGLVAEDYARALWRDGVRKRWF